MIMRHGGKRGEVLSAPDPGEDDGIFGSAPDPVFVCLPSSPRLYHRLLSVEEVNRLGAGT